MSLTEWLSSFEWLRFDDATAKNISSLGVIAFIVMVILCAVMILTNQSKTVVKWVTRACFGLCFFVSAVTATLYAWHNYYR